MVKDAKTIADVRIQRSYMQDHNDSEQISGIRDNTKLFQWIKNQQKEYAWLLMLITNELKYC